MNSEVYTKVRPMIPYLTKMTKMTEMHPEIDSSVPAELKKSYESKIKFAWNF